jgi:hypothetical protein|tara:strand:+ start:2326 stop:3948 length:1623 start_codon:yes stop_codon:yes gene_type:complete
MINKINFNYFVIFFFTIYFLIGSLIFDDYLITPDEELHRINGLISLKYILDLFSISSNNLIDLQNIPDLYNDWRKTYGVLFDLPLSFLQFFFNVSNQDIFLLRHFLVFFIFFIANIYFYLLLKKRFKNEKLAFLGVLILASTPRIFSHSFYNSKDILFLSLMLISIFYCIKLLRNFNFKTLFLSCLFCAFATNVRIIGIYLPILTLIFYIFLENHYKKIDLLKFFISFFLIFFFILYLTWPFLWLNPLDNFILILKESASYPNHWNFKTLYLGNYLNPENLPWHYFFIWFFTTTPIFFLIIIFFGVFIFLKNYLNFFLNIDFKKKIFLWKNNNQMNDLFIFLNFFIPIFFVISLNSTIYNGWRHLYFLYPFLIYLSIYGLILLNKKININIFKLILLIIVAQSISNIVYIYKAHPVQNVYFNVLSKPFIKGNLPVDYWGLGNKKTIDFLLSKKKTFSISNSSFTPLSNLKFSKNSSLSYADVIKFNGTQEKYKINSDFIFTNYIFNDNPLNNKKFQIPKNYQSYFKLIIDGIIVNEIFIK